MSCRPRPNNYPFALVLSSHLLPYVLLTDDLAMHPSQLTPSQETRRMGLIRSLCLLLCTHSRGREGESGGAGAQSAAESGGKRFGCFGGDMEKENLGGLLLYIVQQGECLSLRLISKGSPHQNFCFGISVLSLIGPAYRSRIRSASDNPQIA